MNFITKVSNGIQLEAKKNERSELRSQLEAMEGERADIISKARMDELCKLIVEARDKLDSEVFTPMKLLPDAPSSTVCIAALDELILAMNAKKVNPEEALRDLDARKEETERQIKKLNIQLDKLRGKR